MSIVFDILLTLYACMFVLVHAFFFALWLNRRNGDHQ